MRGGTRTTLQPPLTLQPGAEGLDTYLDQATPSNNYGVATVLSGGHRTANGELTRALVKFDLSALPPNAQIVSATLSLTLFGNFAGVIRTFRWYRQKRAWVEAQATWNNWAAGQAWQTAGGFGANDCEQTDIGSLSIPAADSIGTEHAWALTPSAIQNWYSGDFANNGLLLKADTESNDEHLWDSSDGANAAARPKLVIVYTLPQNL
jgi:hypothetical protein